METSCKNAAVLAKLRPGVRSSLNSGASSLLRPSMTHRDWKQGMNCLSLFTRHPLRSFRTTSQRNCGSGISLYFDGRRMRLAESDERLAWASDAQNKTHLRIPS